MGERDEVEAAIAALEAQRALLGDEVVDVAIRSLRDQLAALEPAGAGGMPAAAAATTSAPETPARQRRQITVLFADVAGFTALSEGIDVEDVADAVNGLWAALDREVIEHGGRVDKHIGDALMALWGVDGGREDDAERAVRCALAMQSHVGDFVDRMRELNPEAPVPSLRVGLNTGQALLASVGLGGEFSAIGDAVNTASRIESSAGPGEVVIGRPTYRLVRGVFFVQEREPVRVKGKSEELVTYTVDGLRPRAFRVRRRGLEGVDVQMVGRSAELTTLTDRTRRAIATSETLVTVVTGEPGIGKSRLHFELREWLEVQDPVRYFEASGSEELRGVPFGLLRELLAFRFEIPDTELAAAAEQRLVDGWRDVVGSDDVDDAYVLGHLAGWGLEDHPAVSELAGAEALLARGVRALRRLLSGATRAYPVVMVLDDVHWADTGTLQLLDRVLAGPSLGPVHVVLLTRDLPTETLPATLDRPGTASVSLTLLDDAAAAALVAELLQRVDGLPDELVAQVVRQAGGNPFFLEEIVTMLLDAGVIRSADARPAIAADTWVVDRDRLEAVTIPTTVAEVVERRLDALEAPLRAALEAAAVTGPEFWDEALAAILDIDPDVARRRVAVLEERQFVQSSPATSVEGAREYVFRHALTRDVTYGAVLRERRRALHLAAGHWFARRLGARGAGRDAVVAQHFQRGGDDERAGTWWLRTGQRQERRAAYVQARSAYRLAADLRDDHVRREAMAGLARAATVLGDTGEADRLLHDAAELCRSAGDDDRLLLILGERMRLAAMMLGDRAAAEEAEREGQEVLPRVASNEPRLEFLRHRATRHIMTGTPDGAARAAEEAVAEARRHGTSLALAMLLNHLAHVRCIQGRVGEARDLTAEVLAIGEALGNRRVAMFGTAHLGFACQREGRPDEALEHFATAMELAEAISDRGTVPVLHNHLGECHADAGRADEAERAHLRALAGEPSPVDAARALLGLARVAELRGDLRRRDRLAGIALGYPGTPMWARVNAASLAVPVADSVDTATILAAVREVRSHAEAAGIR